MKILYRYKETDFYYIEENYQVEIVHGTDRREKDIETMIIPISHLRAFVQHTNKSQYSNRKEIRTNGN